MAGAVPSAAGSLDLLGGLSDLSDVAEDDVPNDGVLDGTDGLGAVDESSGADPWPS